MHGERRVNMRASSLMLCLVSALAATGAFGQARLGPPGEENPAAHQPTGPAARLGDAPRMIVKFRSTDASDRAQIQSAKGRVQSAQDEAAAQAASSSVVAVFAGRSGLAIREARDLLGGLHLLRIDARAGESFQQQLERVRSDPDIEFAVADERRFPHAVPTDTLYATQQWYLQNGAYTGAGADPTVATQPSAIHAQSAWDLGVGTSNVVIAVIDTGVLYLHPDLGSRLLPGYDFITNPLIANDGNGRDADATDAGDWVTSAEDGAANGPFSGCGASNSSWHGTRTSGIIGAVSNNAQGVAGITWNTRVLPARALGKCGGQDSDIIDAMAWSAGIHVANVPDNPQANWAKIENLSLGSTEACPASYQSVVATLTTMGVVVVASAGNENGPVDTPANCPGVVAVAGLRHTGTKVGFSSLGPEVALGAPGGNCVNTTGGPCLFSIGTTTGGGTTVDNGSYIYTDQINNINVGTSFSAPIVSGILGLMASANSHLTPAQLVARLKESATPYPVSSDPNAPPMCPTTNSNSECSCTTSTCGAGMANAENSIKDALRPIAVLTAPPPPVTSGQNVTLSGVGSTVADGHTVATYLWTVVTGTASLTSTDQITTSLVAPNTGTLDVRFTITDDAGRQDSKDWNFQAVTMTISPTSATVQTGATQAFTVTVQNAVTPGVTYQVNGVSGGNATVGIISASGVYTAPAAVPSPATVTVTAASVQDPSSTVSAQVTITGPPIGVTVAPTSVSLAAGGGTQAFTSTVTNTTNMAVTWSVNGVVGGNATVGTISTGGLYTAPAAVPTPAAVLVAATSVQDTTRSGSAQVTVTAPGTQPTSSTGGGGGGGGALDLLGLLALVTLGRRFAPKRLRAQPAP
jgi:serine protease